VITEEDIRFSANANLNKYTRFGHQVQNAFVVNMVTDAYGVEYTSTSLL